MSYVEAVVGWVKAVIEIIPMIGPMLRTIKYDDYASLVELFKNVQFTVNSPEEIPNMLIDSVNKLTNNNIFTCIKGRIIAERLRLTAMKHSRKRITFLELDNKFSKLNWNSNMSIEDLYKFTLEINKLYPLIVESINNISDKPAQQTDMNSIELINYNRLLNIYQTDVNVYKNLLIDLIFLTKCQYDNNHENHPGYTIITNIFANLTSEN